MIAGQGTVEHVEFASSGPGGHKEVLFRHFWLEVGSVRWFAVLRIFETPTGASVGMGKTGRGQTPTVLVYLLNRRHRPNPSGSREARGSRGSAEG